MSLHTGSFFDDYPLFYGSSKTSATSDRLGARYAAIIEAHQALIRGSRVLDLASHDGRWSFAALSAGAAHVVGIEARQELVANAHTNFAEYGINRDRYEFIVGDVFKVLTEITVQVDVVFCLGYLYHTIKHVELLDLIERTGARQLILDTEIVRNSSSQCGAVQSKRDGVRKVWEEPLALQLIQEPVENESMAFKDDATRSGHALVARPSLEYLQILLDHFGFSVSKIDWGPILLERAGSSGLNDYAEGWRGTFLCNRQGTTTVGS